MGDLNYLDLNHEDPFTRYNPPDGLLGSFNGAGWARKAWKHECRPNSNDWCCGLIFACDETLVGSHLGRASVTPLVFTLAIFNESLRNRKLAWRPLGNIYDLSIHGKAMAASNTRTGQRKMKPEEKCARHHKILSVILEELVMLQPNGGIHDALVQLGGGAI
jgi:hypothetical protein